jgi:hypothetical protein
LNILSDCSVDQSKHILENDVNNASSESKHESLITTTSTTSTTSTTTSTFLETHDKFVTKYCLESLQRYIPLLPQLRSIEIYPHDNSDVFACLEYHPCLETIIIKNFYPRQEYLHNSGIVFISKYCKHFEIYSKTGYRVPVHVLNVSLACNLEHLTIVGECWNVSMTSYKSRLSILSLSPILTVSSDTPPFVLDNRLRYMKMSLCGRWSTKDNTVVDKTSEMLNEIVYSCKNLEHLSLGDDCKLWNSGLVNLSSTSLAASLKFFRCQIAISNGTFDKLTSLETFHLMCDRYNIESETEMAKRFLLLLESSCPPRLASFYSNIFGSLKLFCYPQHSELSTSEEIKSEEDSRLVGKVIKTSSTLNISNSSNKYVWIIFNDYKTVTLLPLKTTKFKCSITEYRPFIMEIAPEFRKLSDLVNQSKIEISINYDTAIRVSGRNRYLDGPDKCLLNSSCSCMTLTHFNDIQKFIKFKSEHVSEESDKSYNVKKLLESISDYTN